MGITFTIMLPVHRPPVLLPYALDSVLAQARKDFELFLICDGAPAETVEFAHAAARRDARIRVRAHPKGERNGEAWRHAALQEAQGALVCQMADDDLWLPNHLVEMAKLLEEFEFGNVPQVEVGAGNAILVRIEDLGQPRIRERMVNELYNFFSPMVAGYRMSAYRRLPVGWAPTPASIWPDLNMWRKFLALPGIVCGTRYAFTNFCFPTHLRAGWTLERRKEEIKAWAARAGTPQAGDRMFQDFLRQTMHEQLAIATQRREQMERRR
jgi:glycosyltransferase involved in cell wall biosynthesis